jgi:transposase
MAKIDGRTLTAEQLTDLRTRAVAAVQQGQSPETVAEAMGVHRSTLYGWLARYRGGGWGNLDAKKRGGRPPKLDAKSIQWVFETVTTQQPDQLRFPFALWTVKILRELIARHLGIKLGKSSMHRLLDQLGLSAQRPLWRAWQQDTEQVRQFKEKTYPELAARAGAEGGEIWFADEAGVRSDGHAGTTWALKGQTPVVASTGARFSLNLISAVSRRGELRFMGIEGRMNAAKFIDFLKRMLQDSQRKIFLIVDGHPCHKAKKVRDFVEARSEEIELHLLPPYSPELNPDEHVWNELKTSTVGRMAITGPDQLKRVVFSHMRRIQKLPDKIKSSFRAPETAYTVAA